MHIHVKAHLPAPRAFPNGRLETPFKAAAVSMDSAGGTESHPQCRL